MRFRVVIAMTEYYCRKSGKSSPVFSEKEGSKNRISTFLRNVDNYMLDYTVSRYMKE
jgi:hypothetical protein